MTSISLKSRVRPGETLSAGAKTPRTFLDFVVDGRSLFDELTARGYDFVSCLAEWPRGVDGAARARLMLQSPGDLPSGRVALYVCPECGDLGCGSLSVCIQRTGDLVVWRGFGYENNYDPNVIPMDGIGPFEFAFRDYSSLLGAPSSASRT